MMWRVKQCLVPLRINVIGYCVVLEPHTKRALISSIIVYNILDDEYIYIYIFYFNSSPAVLRQFFSQTFWVLNAGFKPVTSHGPVSK